MTVQDLSGYRRNHRKLPDVQPCGERHERYLHCETCYPIPPERPEKLQGPEVGALVLYQDDRYQPEPIVVRVVERSYVWAPHDPAYHGGARRYDLKVIDRGPKGRLLVDDAKLSPLPLGREAPR